MTVISEPCDVNARSLAILMSACKYEAHADYKPGSNTHTDCFRSGVLRQSDALNRILAQCIKTVLESDVRVIDIFIRRGVRLIPL